jgi:hypothetical protein
LAWVLGLGWSICDDTALVPVQQTGRSSPEGDASALTHGCRHLSGQPTLVPSMEPNLRSPELPAHLGPQAGDLTRVNDSGEALGLPWEPSPP